MKLLVMSDIHGNLSALEAVLDKAKSHAVDACVLLGDLIDYGMRSNEVVATIANLHYPIICNIWGNHEQAIICEDYERFSSQRGKDCAKYTKSVLSESTLAYIKDKMLTQGLFEFETGGKKCLAVHGSLSDAYWKSINPSDALIEYEAYDYVFSGHSHLPHFFEKYYKTDDINKRNKKKVVFINPGSVGQPRNLNPLAQFVILDTDSQELYFEKVAYDIKCEQNFYAGNVDEFYKNRLKEGV